jgi:hypothetical protein
VRLRCKDSGGSPTRRVRDGSLAPLTPLYGRKTASGDFQCGKRSWLWRAVWSRPPMTRSRPLPVSAMPRRRCYLRRSIAIGSNPMDGSATETGPSSWLEQPAGFARGCVKTLALRLRIESSSRFHQSENQKHSRAPSGKDNRENNAARF